MRKTLCFFILILGLHSAFADVVTPGETERRFLVLNTSDFPEVEFLFNYQNYYYDQGYQQGKPEVVMVEEGQEYSAGDRYSSTNLMAREKGEENVEWTADKSLGGKEILRDDDVSYILDEVKIISMNDGRIKFKVVKTSWVYPDGKKIKEGMINVGGPIYLIVAGIFLILLVFFLVRRQSNPFKQD